MTTQELQNLLQLNHGVSGDSLNFNNLKQAILDVKTTADYEYSETTITSNNILALDDIELLPNAPVDGYYDIKKIIFEYNEGTTQYSMSSPNALVLEQGSDMGLVSDNLITAGKSKIVILSSFNPYNEDVDGGADNQNTAAPFDKGANLNLYWYSSGTPSGGDGTILVKVWYKVKAIGTEL